jgi:phage host-nuclease inhibitor protein Gam
MEAESTPRPETLSEILAEYSSVMLALDAADGEIDADIAPRLSAAEGSLGDKLERIEHVVESLRGKAKSVRERVKALENHARALENRANRIHDWAVGELENAGLEAYETDSYSWHRRLNPPALEIVDEERLKEFLHDFHRDMIKVVESIDKKAVLALAKVEGGLPGAEVVRGSHWRIS